MPQLYLKVQYSNKILKKSYDVLGQLELQDPALAKETKSVLQKQFQQGNITNISNKSHSPILSSNTIGRNEPCTCGSGKKI